MAWSSGRFGRVMVAAVWLLAVAGAAGWARAGGFSDFAADEDICRHVGTAAINGGSGPKAAQRYDAAYRRCMAEHGMRRQFGGAPDGALDGGEPGPPYRASNPHSFDFPDAFYSIPYATPGYGYDGFGY